MPKLTVLITGCSKHSKEIVDALTQNDDGVEVDVVAVNMDKNKLLRHGTRYQYVAPPITDEGYIPFLKRVCKETNTNIIIPYITAELELMAKHKQEFEEMGVHVSVSGEESIKLLNDKIAFGMEYEKYMPKQYICDNLVMAEKSYSELVRKGRKVCCKISGKCGGTGFCIIDNQKAYDINLYNRCGINRYISYSDFEKIVAMGHEVIVQEYTPGIDYSVCVLADHGEVISMVGYVGYDMDYGAVVNGEIVPNREAFGIVHKICEETNLDGNACFDFILKKTDRESSLDAFEKAEPVLLECNPRINASIGFAWKAGANLVYMRCKQLLGTLDKEEVWNTVLKWGLKMQKYYEAEYYI